MTAPNDITPAQLSRRIGLPDAPLLIDVRLPENVARDPRQLPAATVRDHRGVAEWARTLETRTAVVICEHGGKLSQGTAAWLRHEGVAAEVLEGGFAAWVAAGLPLLRPDHIPPRDAQGRTLWVTRARPKVDRIACPWLIRRFVDPAAVFLFVAPAEVTAVAERFGATPFDIEGVFWSHRGAHCSFDTMLDEFGLQTAPLQRLALIVRGRRYGAAGAGAAGGRAARRLARPVAHAPRRPGTARSGDAALRCLLPLVPRRGGGDS